MHAAGARFAIACFTLPVIDPSCLHGILIVFLVDTDGIVASTSLDKNPTLGPASLDYGE